MSTRDQRLEAIDAAAADWVVRLGAPGVSAEQRRAFERWLEESADHRRRFAAASALWQEAGTLPRPAPRQVWRSRPLRAGAAALAAGLLLAAVLTIALPDDPLVLIAADYSTSVGEREEVLLPDGSIAELDTATAIALHFDDDGRRVELLNGRAEFRVAPVGDTEKRPFEVDAGPGVARALGTAFQVSRSADGGEVIVTEHRVAVRTGASRTVVVSAGEKVAFAGDRLGEVQAADLAHVTAWQRGKLIFDRVALSEVVAALNRYRRGRILIADSALADREVSGVFSTERPDAAVSAIAAELGLSVASLPPFITLLY